MSVAELDHQITELLNQLTILNAQRIAALTEREVSKAGIEQLNRGNGCSGPGPTASSFDMNGSSWIGGKGNGAGPSDRRELM